jgi:hypothetical protein
MGGGWVHHKVGTLNATELYIYNNKLCMSYVFYHKNNFLKLKFLMALYQTIKGLPCAEVSSLPP